MRITFVLASGFGLSGGERNLAHWANHLQQRGHPVVVVSPPRRTRTWREHARRWKRFDFERVSTASHFDSVNVPRIVLDKRRPVADADVPDADVVIATWWETAEWVAALSPRKGAKAYLIQHHEIFDYLPQARVAATYRLPLQKIATAAWLQEIMRDEYGDAQVLLTGQGVDRALFDAPPRNKQNPATFGFMYSPLYWKGSDVVLNAIALAQQEIPGIRIVVFGSEAPTAQLPLPRSASFFRRPPQSMLRELYARCDAWLFGSRSEGFSLPPLEAMACRTPVIGTPAGGEAELIRQGGLLVPKNDSAAMAQRILDVAAMSGDEWRALSDKAYQLIAPYTWERATDQLERALCIVAERANYFSGFRSGA